MYLHTYHTRYEVYISETLQLNLTCTHERLSSSPLQRIYTPTEHSYLMSLRRRMSQHPPPGLSYIDETMAHIEIDDTTLAEPKAGQHLNRLELEQENKQLRLELEDVKKLLDWYVHNSTRRTQNSSPIKSNNKRSPPPSVPTLRQQALISSGKYRTAHRKGPDQIELSAVSLGLHHRRTPGEEEDMHSNPRIALLKSKDSNDHLPDDVESPSPRYACKEGVSLPLLQNDSFGEEEDAILKDENDDDNTTDIGFGVMIMDRAGWLVGLLVLQSMSSFIIQRNEGLLQKHLVIVRFLTMLVGAGGNAGNQASVRGTFFFAVAVVTVFVSLFCVY